MPISELTKTKLLTPAEVAKMFGVDSKTVGVWCRYGKIPEEAYLMTPGGHRRFRHSEIVKLIGE